jgi:hypothetical protein
VLADQRADWARFVAALGQVAGVKPHRSVSHDFASRLEGPRPSSRRAGPAPPRWRSTPSTSWRRISKTSTSTPAAPGAATPTRARRRSGPRRSAAGDRAGVAIARPEARPHVSPPGADGSAWAAISGSPGASFARAPSFAALAIATLGLGAGAATAIFSVVDAVLLKPLPYRAPDELVAIWETNAEKALPKERLSPVNFMDYRALDSAFADAARGGARVSSIARARIRVASAPIETSANLFQVLGVSPQLGPASRRRTASTRASRSRSSAIASGASATTPTRDRRPAARRQRRQNTNRRRDAAGFNFPDDVDVWLRLQWDLTQHSRGAHFMEAIARLQPGVTPERAARDLPA